MPATSAKLKITYTDGTEVEVLAGPRAQVEMERHFKISVQEANRIEHVYWLAWKALFLAGKEPGEFEGFLDRIADVDQLDEVPANPTQGTLPSESS